MNEKTMGNFICSMDVDRGWDIEFMRKQVDWVMWI